MILAVDVGNTNIVFGGYVGEELKFISRLNTQVSRMEDQYAIKLRDILSLYGHSEKEIKGCIISSVVPPITTHLSRGIEKLCKVKPLVVSPGIKTGLNIKIDDPSILGSDLACAAVAAKNKYKMPCIFIDIGTCLKIFALDKEGALLGGAIGPGVKLSFEALSSKTASLPLIGAQPVEKVIGTNSPDSMRAGVITGTACMIDGMIERYEEVLGEKATVVATGGYSALVTPLCKREMELDSDLVLEGLRIIYNKNQKNA
jgi:type III pantothenate kinase